MWYILFAGVSSSVIFLPAIIYLLLIATGEDPLSTDFKHFPLHDRGNLDYRRDIAMTTARLTEYNVRVYRSVAKLPSLPSQ